MVTEFIEKIIKVINVQRYMSYKDNQVSKYVSMRFFNRIIKAAKNELTVSKKFPALYFQAFACHKWPCCLYISKCMYFITHVQIYVIL